MSPTERPPLRLRDIGDEAVLLAGGGRAVLLQLAHPSVGHAVAEHSGFSADPTRRLRHTLTFVYATLWGSPAQAEMVRRMVNRAHAPVRSEADGDIGYSAFDPELQLWVAATLYDSAIAVRERIYGPLSDTDAEAVYRDYAEIGVALQMPLELWPADRAAFAGYWERSLAALSVDGVIREVAQRLLFPPVAPLWLRAAMPMARLLTAGLLPPAVRDAFGLAWDDRRAGRFDRLMRVTAYVYPKLPAAVRYWPKNRLLRSIPG